MLTTHPHGTALADAKALSEALWIDLLDPSASEVAAVQRAVGVELPTRSEMQEIETSSRLYQENNALFMTATLLQRAHATDPELSPVTFVLTENTLVTIRYADPRPFASFRMKLEKAPHLFNTRSKIFSSLVDEIIDRLADILEHVGAELEAVSRIIFNSGSPVGSTSSSNGRGRDVIATAPDYTSLLERIGRNGELASKARESLVSLSRMVAFYIEIIRAISPQELDEHWRTVRSDVASLMEHATFLSSKVNFFLDAILGMINIEQSAIIKIFSIAAVVFLPPTLVASIYGMNFRIMPERDWALGYPLALVLMVISAILPLWYFKRKRWL